MTLVNQLKIYIPKFLTQKKTIMLFFALVVLFCIFFVAVYRPIGLLKPTGLLSSLDYRLYSIILVFIGLVVFSVSRWLLFITQKRISMKLGSYLVWIGVELFVLVASLSTAAWLLNENDSVGLPDLVGRVFVDIVALLTVSATTLTAQTCRTRSLLLTV